MQQPSHNPDPLIIEPGPNEYYITGGPGCGKTHYLSETISRAVADGLTPIVISLTRNSAEEAAKRTPYLHQTRVGTIHSHCIRALGNPDIADHPEGIRAWNGAHFLATLSQTFDRDEFELDRDLGDSSAAAQHPDLLMLEYQCLRATRQPIPTDGPLAAFAREWRDWCSSTKALDCHDLLERCLSDNVPPQGNPDCIFVDEAQDLTPLELALIRQWSSAGIPVVFAGDPNQSLYQWRGSDSSALLGDQSVPPDHQRILRQSHRVPQSIHTATIKWMTECPTKPRIDYQPRDVPGNVTHSPATWHHPEQIIQQAEQAATEGHSVMILASCAYMLRPTIAQLIHRAIPFHNSWRPSNREWNSNSKSADDTTPAQRIQAFIGFDPSAPNALINLSRWTPILSPAAAFTDPRQGPAQLWSATSNPSYSPQAESLSSLVSAQALAASAAGDLRWLSANLAAECPSQVRYTIHLATRHGAHILDQEPRITVGTIHSVKGAETDVAYLYPDLPLPDMRDWLGRPDQLAGVYRQFYVGMTRPRDSLTICAPAGSMTVDL